MIGPTQTLLTVAWLAQARGPATDIDIGTGLAGGATGAFLTTLVVGAIVIAVAPAFTERTIDVLLEGPLASFVVGLLALLALVVVTVALVLTIIGIVAAIPLSLVAIVLWAAGSAIAYLAIADRLIGRREGWLKPLVIGAAINGVLALTGIGGLLAFAIGAAGFGAVIRSALA